MQLNAFVRISKWFMISYCLCLLWLFFFLFKHAVPSKVLHHIQISVGGEWQCSIRRTSGCNTTHTYTQFIHKPECMKDRTGFCCCCCFFFILFMYSGWLTATSTGLKHRYLTHQQKTRALLPASMHLSRVFRLPICNIWFPFLLFFVFRPGLISLNMASQGETAKP